MSQQPGADIATEAVRVVSEAVPKPERDGTISEGSVSHAAATTAAGDDEGQVREGSSLVVGNVGTVAAEAFGWVEDGRRENVSLVVRVQTPIPVGLGARVATLIAQSSLIKVNEVAVPPIASSQFTDQTEEYGSSSYGRKGA